MYSDALTVELRARGHDAISVRDAEIALAGMPDDEVLKVAVAEGRTLVTENVRDYRPLETDLFFTGHHHHGIIYTTNRQFPRGEPHTIGRLVRALDALARDPLDLRDRSVFLPPAAD